MKTNAVLMQAGRLAREAATVLRHLAGDWDKETRAGFERSANLLNRRADALEKGEK